MVIRVPVHFGGDATGSRDDLFQKHKLAALLLARHYRKKKTFTSVFGETSI